MGGHPSTGSGMGSYYIEEHTSNVQTMQSLITTLVIEGVPAAGDDSAVAEAAALLHSRDILELTFAGDVPHTLADVSKAKRLLGWQPRHDLVAGLRATARWMVDHAAA